MVIPRVAANRDQFNGQVRVVFRDPQNPGQVTIHWLTDDEAAKLATDLNTARRA